MKLNRFAGAALAALLLSGGVAVTPVSAAPVMAPAPASVDDKTALPKDLPANKGRVGQVPKGVDLKKLRSAPKGMAPFKSAKSGVSVRSYPPTTGCGATCYSYAGWGDNFGIDTATGASASMTIANSYLATTSNNNMGRYDSHSLLELAVAKPGSSGRNIVEIGSTKDPAICGQSTEPCMFVYSWIKSVGQGYNNLPGSGFVDLSGGVGYSPVGPGGSLLSAVGTNKSFKIRYLDNTLSGGREGWWTSYDNLYVGYYPIAHWTSAGETFVDLTDVQQFSEIAGPYTESCSDLGNGLFSSNASATTLANYVAYDTTETLEMDWNNIQTDSTKWSTTKIGTPVTSFRVGGPGGNSIGTAVGYTGSCGPSTAGTPAASSWQFYREIAPDNQTVTGSQNAVNYTYTSTPIGTCFTVLNWGTVPIHAFHNNASSSGKTIQLFKTNNCTGTFKQFGNQAKEAFPAGGGWDGYNIQTFKRVA